ncbi:CRISPR-associated ring nuclease [Rhodoferax sp.]|uniref:CRISPR-associated ring nuclease n=1 Tax=Rhodoferax sp. TaxID=50421 RepID=UPI002728D32F|nr:CRISPR-associated ring nuclease [Rhodoferax sp.]MDO8320516.1 CRISPR-associated ring nuclease [Rhodoferax sp.]
MNKNILLCTLGSSWAVIPEIMGWLAPDVLDLYAHHPQRAALDAVRRQHGLKAPDELWVCTTEGAQTQASLAYLTTWWRQLGQVLPLRVWTAAGTDQLASQPECDHIRELTMRVTLLASEQVRGGQLVLSLAGGRKTMSADLQTAGSLFGARAWLHVVSPEPAPAALFARTDEAKAAQPALFSQPLPAELAAAITPLVAGVGTRNELLDIAIDGQRVDSHSFALPLAASGTVLSWPLPPEGDALQRELVRRQAQSSQLMGNFMAQLAQTEHHDNWRSLYRLPPAQIQALRATRLGPEHTDWLSTLPKADLHRHLGGCLDLAAQRDVAQAIWDSMRPADRLQRQGDVAWLLMQDDWPWDWPQRLRAQPAPHPGQSGTHTLRAERCAMVLLNADDETLQRHLFDVTEPRVALKARHPHGFSAYERPGELSGSALLSHPAALKPYAQALVAQARAEGLVYLELRGSPHKYCPHDPAGFLRDLCTALLQAGAQVAATPSPAGESGVRIGFIWILDRRQSDTMAQVVLQAANAHPKLNGFLLGLDLAGDEGTHAPQTLASAFMPAFANCLPLTIHAGEGESAQHIWQAAYHLHADRIGHGLTLADHPQLMARFRDRGICLELCPTSNREVVGFADPAFPASAGLPKYPLRQFMLAGLPLALCTDNPAISRTTLACEFLAAARMTDGGLSLWECLALIRQSFVHAFLPSAEREALLKRVDGQIFAILTHQ